MSGVARQTVHVLHALGVVLHARVRDPPVGGAA
jgi:hypothetical protein